MQGDFGFETPPRPKKKRVKRRVKKRVKKGPKLGRPRKKAGEGLVSHKPRTVNVKEPLHVTLKMKQHVWQLRSQRCFRVIELAFYRGCAKFGGRLCQFSVQHNHVHMVVEAPDRVELARAIQGMCIRIAKGLNRLMGKKGAVFVDRYHSRSLRTPTEVRAVLVYVLGNARKHAVLVGKNPGPGWVDEYSSALWFLGWTVTRPTFLRPGPVAPAGAWLLREGFIRGGGRIRPDEMPAHA